MQLLFEYSPYHQNSGLVLRTLFQCLIRIKTIPTDIDLNVTFDLIHVFGKWDIDVIATVTTMLKMVDVILTHSKVSTGKYAQSEGSISKHDIERIIVLKHINNPS
jgi:hypothetical protein